MSKLTIFSMVIVSGIAVAGCAMTAEEDEAELFDEPDETVAVERGSSGFQPIAPCAREADYVSSGIVNFGWGRRPFTPACVRLPSGGTVFFQGPSDEHTIVPRPLGSPYSPIALLRTVGGSEVEFQDQGFFPFQCERHPEEVGVVWSSYAF